MRIYLIRHGDPNYKDNSITPLGHLEAEALAKRFERSGKKFSAVYASDYGRAIETAEHTASRLGLDLRILGFMHEIAYGYPGATKEEKVLYSPWKAPADLVESDVSLPSFDYGEYWGYKGTRLVESEKRVNEGFDKWLEETQGLRREGTRYFCTRENTDEILIFCHGGTISCLIGHLLNIGLLAGCMSFRIHTTGVTTVEFRCAADKYVLPIFKGISDFSHCENIVYVDPEKGCFGEDPLI